MSDPLWLRDILKWNTLSLSRRLEHLRKHFCSGTGCGQPNRVQATTAVIDATLKEAIKIAWANEDELFTD